MKITEPRRKNSLQSAGLYTREFVTCTVTFEWWRFWWPGHTAHM